MTHVFVAPHPDDVALSCGGLIASLRELGQNVTIITVFSGNGEVEDLTHLPARGARLREQGDVAGDRGVQPRRPSPPTTPTRARPGPPTDEALEATQADADAAAKRFWQRSSWYRRASIRNESLAGQPVIDDLPTQGAVLTEEIIEAAAAGDLMARRRIEDERYAYFAEAGIVFLDLPDAVFRGYEGDDQLLGTPARRRHRAVRPPARARSPGSSRRRSTCRWASAGTSTTSCAATSGSACSTSAGAGSCPARSTPARSSSTRTSRTRTGTSSALDQLGADSLVGAAGAT